MKAGRLLVGLTSLVLLQCSPLALAQFYAPDTEYHDMIQRVYVVELARVLAWRENLQEPKIQEVTYKVAIDKDRKTIWDLKWLDAQGKPVKQAQISYPECLLTNCPSYYRGVFKQMWTVGWRAAPSSTEQDMVKNYWQGADGAGMSRVEGIAASFKLAPPKPTLPEQEYAPKLAGLLANTTLPTLSDSFTIDSVLLGRAAAWLCLSETMMKDRTERSDALWSPILFLAARENAAMTLWKKNVSVVAGGTSKSVMFSWWNFLLRGSPSKEVFLFAASPEHRRQSMPFLVYVSKNAELNTILASLTIPFFNDKERTLLRLYDYSPFFSRDTGIGGGRILEGLWPALARLAWLRTLGNFPATALDYTGYGVDLNKTIQETSESFSRRNAEQADASLIGFESAAPLIGRGFGEGMGKLIPVATVTSRDLLNYGWEMTGLQMSYRYIFVNDYWGVPDQAKPIQETTLKEINGMDPFFFIANEYLQGKVGAEDLSRLQWIDRVCYRRLSFAPARVWSKISEKENAIMFGRRCWLRPELLGWQCSALANAGAFDELGLLIKRYHQEGGPCADERALAHLTEGYNKGEDERVPGFREMRTQIASSLEEPTRLQVNAMWDKYFKMPEFQRAQELEKLYWRKPGDWLYDEIFYHYIMAHAYKSAKRFFDQINEIVEERVGFSNGLGPGRFFLAVMEGDTAGMKSALDASRTGSGSDMLMDMYYCVWRDDVRGLEAQIWEAEARYESYRKPDSGVQFLRRLIPLIPPLKTPSHPDRAKVLDFCAREKGNAQVDWILIRQYKVGTDEAVRLLGGRDSDPVRQLMVFYLLKDKDSFTKVFDQQTKSGHWMPITFTMMYYLRNDLLNTPIPTDQPDLRPKDVQTIPKAILEKLEAQRKNASGSDANAPAQK